MHPKLAIGLACCLTFLSGAASAQGPVTLFEDGSFSGWTTAPRNPQWEASGARQTSGGNPGAHYLVTHVHRAGAPLAPNLVSDSLYAAASFELPPAAPGALAEFRLDLRGEDPQPGLAPALIWQPFLVQGGRRFRSQDLVSGALPSSYRTDTLAVARERFRADDGGSPENPDFSPGAPPLQLGLTFQSVAITIPSDPRTIRIRMDNLRVRLVPALPEGLSFDLTAHGHRWGDDPLIPYELTVSNSGPPLSGLVITEVVPAGTVFVAGESTPGWSCAPGPDAGSVCTFAMGELATGASRTLAFAARVLDGTPEAFEIFDEAFLELEGSEAPGRGNKGFGRCVRGQVVGAYQVCYLTSFAELGCLCLFDLCHE